MGIAIMSCRKLINKCTGTGCFRSYYENIDSFSIYKEKNDILMSFFIVQGVKKQYMKMRTGNIRLNS